jgi:DNA modification methylase
MLTPLCDPNPVPANGKAKSLCLIPERIVIAAEDDGWIVRDIIIWHKPNAVPESVGDRCTRCYEVLLMLVKQRNYYWNSEEAVEPSICWEKDTWGSAEKTLQARRAKLLPPIGGPKHQQLDKATLVGNRMIMKLTRHLRDVWTIPTHSHRESHIAMFPEELAARCIRIGSKEGDVVLDPFAGSGTTGLVAERLKRNAVLIDISTEYVVMMKRRLEENK